MSELRVTGRAVALERAYYPTSSGVCDVLHPGQEFDVIEGHPIKGWAEKIKAPKPAAEGDQPPGDIA